MIWVVDCWVGRDTWYSLLCPFRAKCLLQGREDQRSIRWLSSSIVDPVSFVLNTKRNNSLKAGAPRHVYGGPPICSPWKLPCFLLSLGKKKKKIHKTEDPTLNELVRMMLFVVFKAKFSVCAFVVKSCQDAWWWRPLHGWPCFIIGCVPWRFRPNIT